MLDCSYVVNYCSFFHMTSCNHWWHVNLQGSCIGLYFINRPEWLIVDHACSAYSYISVPLYDTLGMLSLIYWGTFFLSYLLWPNL